MDIVDINKVLDDLELNEEQHSKLNGPQEDDNIYNNVYGSMGPSVNQHSSTVQSPSSHLNRAAKKKFVNVSNVFNSLNEYVNAGIETVKVTSDKTNLTFLPNEMYSTATIAPTATPATSTSTEITTNIQQTNNVYVDESIAINETVEIPNTESINAFYETNDTTSSIDNNNLSDENEEISTLGHSSMTRTSEYSAINEQETYSISNKLYTENLPMEETPTERTEYTEQTEESTAPIRSDYGDQFIPQLTVSEIENAQNNDNEMAEVAQLKKIKEIKIEHEQRTESIDKLETINHMPFNTENDNINNRFGIASKSSDRFIKPISFETAATMDDVSDTELESYLQELEDLEESANCDSNNPKPNDHKFENIEEVQMQIENRISDDEQNKIEETMNKENTRDLNQNTSIPKDDTIAMFNVIDSNNSMVTVTTVETTTDDNVGDTSTFHQNAPNTLDNNQDVILETNELLNNECVSNNVEGEEISKNMENSSPECKQKQGLNCIELDTNEMTNQSVFTLKRPNTLDLPSVINLSNDDTTGDTPATGQLMTSSMSSSNSDMSSQLMPINDSSINRTPECLNDNVNSELPSHDVTNIQKSSERLAAAAHLINSTNISVNNIGKVQPYWIPDSMTIFCMLCNQKFSFIKRRHHCRACGLVLCSNCCSLKSKLEYLGDTEARICIQCDILLNDNRETNRVCERISFPLSRNCNLTLILFSNFFFLALCKSNG